MTIKVLEEKDWQAASDLLWRSFYFAEKNNTSMQGMENFRDITSPISLAMNSLDGTIVFYGLFEKEILCAVGAVKNKNHILLLYVYPSQMKKGYGKKLLQFMEARCQGDMITVNASDYGIPFYELFGYVVAGERQKQEEMFHTLMIKKR